MCVCAYLSKPTCQGLHRRGRLTRGELDGQVDGNGLDVVILREEYGFAEQVKVLVRLFTLLKQKQRCNIDFLLRTTSTSQYPERCNRCRETE